MADSGPTGARSLTRFDLEGYARDLDAELEQLHRTGFTREVIHESAILGLAGLKVLARGGNTRACMYLVDRLLGSSELSYSETLANISQAELSLSITEALRSLDLPEAVLDLVQERLAARASAAPVVEEIAAALPPPGEP